MLARHGAEIDPIGIFTVHALSVSLVVSEAVLDTDDNPVQNNQSKVTWNRSPCHAYHRFVKTTPKPNATKKRSGELGPLPPPPGLPVGEAVGEDTIDDDNDDDVVAAILSDSLRESGRNQELGADRSGDCWWYERSIRQF